MSSQQVRTGGHTLNLKRNSQRQAGGFTLDVGQTIDNALEVSGRIVEVEVEVEVAPTTFAASNNEFIPGPYTSKLDLAI